MTEFPAPAPPAPVPPAQWEIDLPLFEAEIAAFEAADARNPPPQGATLFIGSSSIRLWPDFQASFAPFQVINRGFGGSQIIHSALFTPRLIWPHRPRAVVFYAGDNDLDCGISPEQVAADLRRFTATVFEALPQTRIGILSIKPSPFRQRLMGEIRAANTLIQNDVDKDARLHYLDIFTPMLGADDTPRRELYALDEVHLSAQGYALWTRHVRAWIKAVRQQPVA